MEAARRLILRQAQDEEWWDLTHRAERLAHAFLGKDDGHPCAFVGRAAQNHACAMGFGQTAHDGKSQSRSRVRHDGIVTALTETFEHLFVFLECDAHAGVPDPEGERTVME